MKNLSPLAGTESVHPREDTNSINRESKRAKWHARLLPELIADPRLKDRDVRVFAGIALYQKGGFSDVGYRQLAKTCNVPFRKLSPILQRLEACGYIKQRDAGIKCRKSYILLEKYYSDEQRQSKPKCAKCGRSKRVNRACYCRDCVNAAARTA